MTDILDWYAENEPEALEQWLRDYLSNPTAAIYPVSEWGESYSESIVACIGKEYPGVVSDGCDDHMDKRVGELSDGEVLTQMDLLQSKHPEVVHDWIKEDYTAALVRRGGVDD